MIVHLNSYPGVGKLTIGTLLMGMIDGKLLDNHSIYNVAFALTEFKSAAFYETVRAVRQIAYARVLAIPVEVPVIITNAHAQDSKWGNECWDEVISLARQRGAALYNVVLFCDPDENVRRIQSSDRKARRKPTDPNLFPGNREGRPLLDRDGDDLLQLDVTNLSAAAAADAISSWLNGMPVISTS